MYMYVFILLLSIWHINLSSSYWRSQCSNIYRKGKFATETMTVSGLASRQIGCASLVF